MDIPEGAVVQQYKKRLSVLLPQPEDPPFLTVGTEVSAKYKGAFCEAKVHKVVKVVKVKVTFKLGLGSIVVSDDLVKGALKIGAQVKASHPDKNQYVDAIVNKIQDCSQYTVVFDDGDITTLRRTSLCLKSGRHFAESETLDQLPLTHPEHFGTPVGGARRGRRSRQNLDGDESGEEEDVHKRHRSRREEWESDIGKVVCVELGDKKRQKDNWFPGLVVAPTSQDSVKIETKKDYLVRSFQDGRYYTVPKKEASPFSREVGSKVSQSALKIAVEKALLFMTNDELPPHWDRDLLFGMDVSDDDSDRDGSESDSSDDEPREEKDHFVAQLYKFMEECGAPINSGTTIGSKDLDLYKLFKVVQKLGGFNRVMNQNQWKVVSNKMQLQSLGSQGPNLIKAAYKRYLQSFEDFYRKLGCTMVSNPRGSRTRHRSGRSLIRDCDRTPRAAKKKDNDSCDSTEEEGERKEDEEVTRKSTERRKSVREDVKKFEDKKEMDTKEMDKEMDKNEMDKKDVDKKDVDKKDVDKKEMDKKDRDKREMDKREMDKREMDKKEQEKKEQEKKEPDKKEPEKKKDEGKAAKNVKQEVQKLSEDEPVVTREKSKEPSRERSKEPSRERSKEPTTSKERSRESTTTRERSRETVAAAREKIRESLAARDRHREPSGTKEAPVEPTTVKEKLREPRTPRSEAKTRAAKSEIAKSEIAKSETVEVKTRSSVKEEKVEVLEVKTRSSTREEKKEEKKDKKEEKKEPEQNEEEEMETVPAQTRSSSKHLEETREKEEPVRKTSTPTRKAKAERPVSVTTTPSSHPAVVASTSGSTTRTPTPTLTPTPTPTLENEDEDDDDDSSASNAPGSTSGPPYIAGSGEKKLKKVKVVKGPPGQIPPPLMAEDSPGARKRGRKKKVEGELEPPVGKSLIPAHVPVSVGDKLKVLYGPSAKESKITYEAKVLEVEEEGNAPMYYVHYLGWNNRYDEWIRRPRIAENVTWSQNRARKGRAAATKELKEKKEKEKDTKKDDKELVAAGSLTKTCVSKRGRTLGGSRERRESERSGQSDTSCTSSVSGPSTRAARERGLSHPDSPSSLDHRRTRHIGTAESDSEDYESDIDTSSEKSRTRSSDRRSAVVSTSSSASSTPTSEPSTATNSTLEKPCKEPQIKVQAIEIKEEEEEEEEQKPCGKDIDLNAIMSEMKGLDKPLKKEEDRSLKEATPRLMSPVLPATFITPEKKTPESPAKPYVESLPKKLVDSSTKPISQDASKLLSPKLESEEDDIYEFKEPEPFDFGEMRARKDVRVKANMGAVSSEESDGDVKGKKKGRPKKDAKDGDGETTESDSDNSPSPQKRLVLARDFRDSPSKRQPPESREVMPVLLEGNLTPEKKDANTVPTIISPPRKVLLKREVAQKTESPVSSISDGKLLKPDFPKCPSPKTSQTEGPKKSLLSLKEPVRLHVIPVKTKPVSSLERPVTSLTKTVGPSSHLLAQAVMPIIESKALAKPVAKVYDVKNDKPTLQVKSDDKMEAKVIPFSQRQQHIFPHLLNRSEPSDKPKDIQQRMATPCIQSPPRENVSNCEPGFANKSSEGERAKRESSVEESIEAVVKRARQGQEIQNQGEDISKTPDKNCRAGRTNRYNLELVSDTTTEESDSDSEQSSPEVDRRRGGKDDSDSEQSNPEVDRRRGGKEVSEGVDKFPDILKGQKLVVAEPLRKSVRRKVEVIDEENDFDDDLEEEEEEEGEEEEEEEEPPPLVQVSSKAKFSKRQDLNYEKDEPQEQEEILQQRKKPRACAAATPKRLEEEAETGLGDLLCQETIPPGSPVTHESSTVEPDSQQHADMKNEMPFASVPTGSSFGKRGPLPVGQTVVTTSHQTSTSQASPLLLSQQQYSAQHQLQPQVQPQPQPQPQLKQPQQPQMPLQQKHQTLLIPQVHQSCQQKLQQQHHQHKTQHTQVQHQHLQKQQQQGLQQQPVQSSQQAQHLPLQMQQQHLAQKQQLNPATSKQHVGPLHSHMQGQQQGSQLHHQATQGSQHGPQLHSQIPQGHQQKHGLLQQQQQQQQGSQAQQGQIQQGSPVQQGAQVQQKQVSSGQQQLSSGQQQSQLGSHVQHVKQQQQHQHHLQHQAQVKVHQPLHHGQQDHQHQVQQLGLHHGQQQSQHSTQYTHSQASLQSPQRHRGEQHQPEQPQHQDQQYPHMSRSGISNPALSPNLGATTAGGSTRTCGSGPGSSAAASASGSGLGAEPGVRARPGLQASAQNTVIDNTPPTTPESIISNISDSPRRDNDPVKLDDTSKSGRDSSEVELESYGDHTKLDQFSEDSNTMDSTLGSEPRRRGRLGGHLSGAMKRQHEGTLAPVSPVDCEGSETEEGSMTPAVPKRRRRGPRVRACNDPDEDDISKKAGILGPSSGRRRRRHSSSRTVAGVSISGIQIDDDPETSGLSALSLACSAARRSRYNFCQELDPDLDATKRIAVLQSRIQELKRTYMQVKTELASVERRRKKLRRKEREKENKTEPT